MINRISSYLTVFLLTTVMTATLASASEWPHWLGPKGNNHVDAPEFDPDLQNYVNAWDAKIGLGYSSVIVAGGKAFAMGHDKDTGETVYCLDADTGRELWKFSYPAQLLPRMHPGGPNASATVVGDRVLTLSKDGQLYCLSVDDGTALWETNLPEAMGINVPQWGFGSSPVVHNGQVFVSAGRVIALDLDSGSKQWVSPEDRPAAYATPVPFESGGKPYIAAMNGKGLSIHSAVDGAEVAHHPIKAQFNLLAPTPYVMEGGSKIFVSANSTSELLAFDGSSLSPVWTTTELKNALNNSVIVNGTIFGIDGPQGKPNCRLVAMNLSDGKLLWAKENFGYGTTIGVGENLLALTENGELVTARLSAGGYEELGRLQILGKTCWTTPTVANNRIFARNDQGALACLVRK